MIEGLVLSNSLSAPNSNLILSTGSAQSRDGSANIVLPAGVEGSPSTALDIGTSLSAEASYHVFVTRHPGTGAVAPLWSRSALNPLLPPGFTQLRRVAGFVTDASANIRPGTWRGDGSFRFKDDVFWRSSVPLGAVTLLDQLVPIGIKMKARVLPVMFNASGNGFYGIMRDPDIGVPPSGGTLGQYALLYKIACPGGTGDTVAAEEWTSADGRLYAASYPLLSTNMVHLYAQGWTDPRDDVGPIFNVSMIGASLFMDRSANNWPQLMARQLSIGKQSRINVQLFGKEGTASSYWISSGQVAQAAAQRPDAALVDVTPDANPGQGVSLVQSLANMYAIVDAVHAQNVAAKIFLCTMNHMQPAATQFATVTDYYAQIDTVIANRSNVAKIDCYTAWGDPSSYPAEYASGDPIHPLLAGNLRVTIPVVSAALSPLIT